MEKLINIGNFGLNDIWTLYRLSLREWVWRNDGSAFIQRLKRTNIFVWLYVMQFVVAFQLAPFVIVPSLLVTITQPHSFRELISVPFLVSVSILMSFCVVDPKKAYRNIMYTKSAWWKNTGVRPAALLSDAGLYGEYLATNHIESEMRKAGIYGKIYNSVLVPMTNQGYESFSESDIIAVTERGIFVFEVKNHSGRIYGLANGKTWFREDIRGRRNNDKKVPEYGNPFRQNQNHINYLIEYLYTCLFCSTRPIKDNIYNYIGNVVMYTDNGRLDVKIDFSCIPSQTYFCTSGGAAAFSFDRAERIIPARMDRDMVNIVCEALDDITQLTPNEHELKLQRKLAVDKTLSAEKKGKAPAYHIVEIKDIYDSSKKGKTMIARFNDDREWYERYPGEQMFWAMPEVFLKEYRSQDDYGDEGYDRTLKLLERKKAV